MGTNSFGPAISPFCDRFCANLFENVLLLTNSGSSSCVKLSTRGLFTFIYLHEYIHIRYSYLQSKSLFKDSSCSTRANMVRYRPYIWPLETKNVYCTLL